MKDSWDRFSFVWVVLACGVFTLLMVLGNLAFLGLQRYPEEPAIHVSGANLNLGREALIRHGCGGCHVIPGLPGATGRVGPSLEGIREQMFLAGVLKNSPENMSIWIQNPQGVSPKTAMPNLGVSEEEARNIAAFLYERSKGRAFGFFRNL